MIFFQIPGTNDPQWYDVFDMALDAHLKVVVNPTVNYLSYPVHLDMTSRKDGLKMSHPFQVESRCLLFPFYRYFACLLQLCNYTMNDYYDPISYLLCREITLNHRFVTHNTLGADPPFRNC